MSLLHLDIVFCFSSFQSSWRIQRARKCTLQQERLLWGFQLLYQGHRWGYHSLLFVAGNDVFAQVGVVVHGSQWPAFVHTLLLRIADDLLSWQITKTDIESEISISSWVIAPHPRAFSNTCPLISAYMQHTASMSLLLVTGPRYYCYLFSAISTHFSFFFFFFLFPFYLKTLAPKMQVITAIEQPPSWCCAAFERPLKIPSRLCGWMTVSWRSVWADPQIENVLLILCFAHLYLSPCCICRIELAV